MEIEVAMVYAEALYGAAKDLGEVEEIRDEITQIDQILRKSRDFSELFLNPAISAAEKKNILKNVFDGRVQKEVLNFLVFWSTKAGLTGFHSIVRQYGKLMDEAEGISERRNLFRLSSSRMRKSGNLERRPAGLFRRERCI